MSHRNESLTSIPDNLRGVVLDAIAIMLVVLANFMAVFIGLDLYSRDEIGTLVKMILVLALGWGPLLFVAARLSNIQVKAFFANETEKERQNLVLWTGLGLIGMVTLGLMAMLVDRAVYSIIVNPLSMTGYVLVYLIAISAINEEFALANLQIIFSGGQRNEMVIIVGIITRGIIFWGLHKPLAYTNAPFGVQLTLFLNGCFLGFVFAKTKRYSVPMLGHLIWNLIAISLVVL